MVLAGGLAGDPAKESGRTLVPLRAETSLEFCFLGPLRHRYFCFNTFRGEGDERGSGGLGDYLLS